MREGSTSWSYLAKRGRRVEPLTRDPVAVVARELGRLFADNPLFAERLYRGLSKIERYELQTWKRARERMSLEAKLAAEGMKP